MRSKHTKIGTYRNGSPQFVLKHLLAGMRIIGMVQTSSGRSKKYPSITFTWYIADGVVERKFIVVVTHYKPEKGEEGEHYFSASVLAPRAKWPLAFIDFKLTKSGLKYLITGAADGSFEFTGRQQFNLHVTTAQKFINSVLDWMSH